MAIRSYNIKNKVYKFSHDEDEFIKTTITGNDYVSDNGFIELSKQGILKINGTCGKGYSWDGCTPKWELFDFTIGTPDGRFDYLTEKQITYYASMVHDAIYQYKSEIPISRKDADAIFYKILKESGFVWSFVYYLFVRLAGSFFGKWSTKKRTKNLRIIECSWINKAYENSLKLNSDFIKEHPFILIAKQYHTES